MKLTQVPEIVTWPETHYVFIGRKWTFPKYCTSSLARPASICSRDFRHNKITGYMSLYKVEPKIYRAGVSLAVEPRNLPEKLGYEKVKGGNYIRFVLTGPYSKLTPSVGPRV